MRLKRLQLQGYKTFASKTDFQFDKGITAIVGPNGSGKSNVADALRWVLGEQSFSALRGKRGTDMIFTGSQSRPRAGLAQAIITLDNSDGWLPIDFTEVEIGRRTHRSGDTEYLLNGQKVRLKDIADLLATSGLAERTYTFIGQGLVDRALSLRAEERRALFEEAAGISHYQSRRAETLRRLQETQRNLQRVHDILSEIRPRLNSLRRQANRAENYQHVADDLRQLLLTWYGYQWEKARIDTRHRRLEADDAQSGWEEGRRALQEAQDAIALERRHLSRREGEMLEMQQAHEALREERERARRQVAILQERRNLLRRQMAELEAEIPQLQSQETSAHAALEEALADLNRAQTELASEQTAFAQFESGFAAQDVEIKKWQATLGQIDRQQRGARQKLAQTEGEISQLRERLAEEGSGEGRTNGLEHAHEQVAAAEKSVAEAEATLESIRLERTTLREEREGAVEQLKAGRSEHEEAQRNLSRLERETAALATRCEMLARRRPAVGELAADLPLVGQLAGLLSIPPDQRIAIEAALAARVTTVVLPDTATLWRLVQRAGQGAPVTAVALDHISLPAQPEVEALNGQAIGWADRFVSADASLQPLIRLLLGPILLVPDAATAYRLAPTLPAGTLAVAPDGFIAHAGGLITSAPDDSSQSVLAQEESWREATARLAPAQAEVEALSRALADLATDVHSRQAAVDQLAERDRQLGENEQEAARDAARMERALDRARQELAYLQDQQEKARIQKVQLQSRLETAQAAVGQHQEQLVRLDAALTTAQARLQALPVAEVRQQREGWQQRLASAQTIAAGREAVVDSRRATLNQAAALLRRRQERLGSLQEQEENLALAEATTLLSGLQHQMEALDADIAPIRTALADGRRRVEALELAAEKAQRHSHDLETFYTQARVRLTQHESHIEGLRERIQQDLGLVQLAYDDEETSQSPLPLEDLVAQLPVVSELPDDLEAAVHRSRAQLQRMGAVNPDAPAEYAETEARFDFLESQVNDLEQTESHLRDVIAELDELTSRSFADTVSQVDTIFGEMFSRLFGGGSAQLVLTEPDDLTISGVDIVARLPSRRQQGLGLLSGGERSLTAAALIFALLKVSPPPFCVMDEVDAMLDEANVNRFRDALQELASETQFIVITHNRGTVQAAQTVYGISMGADSASQVLSVHPEDYVALAE